MNKTIYFYVDDYGDVWKIEEEIIASGGYKEASTEEFILPSRYKNLREDATFANAPGSEEN